MHRCIFAPVTSVNAHYSVLTTPFDMVNAHYVIIDFRAKFFNKIQNQASDTSRSLPSFSSAPFLLRALPSCYARSLASDLGKSNASVNSSIAHPPPGNPRAFALFFCPGAEHWYLQSCPGGGGLFTGRAFDSTGRF